MDHSDYIGKKLQVLIGATPEYAIGFYLVVCNGEIKGLRNILNDQDLLGKTILNISGLHGDYTYYIDIAN